MSSKKKYGANTGPDQPCVSREKKWPRFEFAFNAQSRCGGLRRREVELQVLVYSLEKYDEKFLIPQLRAAISPENVRTVRVPLSLDTADLAKG